ncbi:MAG: T9SS type A sorting domain-containing protein [Candidatus Krumholzibacteriota bacterium]|nr:T9SS type A sorting domain-containing protein [Candidatus Krumholzibacteriota bacterium]
MRKALVILLGVCLLAAFVGTVSARDIDKSGKRIMRALHENENLENIDQGARSLMTAATVDSYCLAWYDFEQMNWQGWTFLDNTEQIEVFFHVDDFAGLGGGAYGALVPLEGTKSMWCGSRAWDDGRSYAPFIYLCSWEAAPGYGNGWNQHLTTDAFFFNGVVSLGYTAYYDVEGGDFDYVLVEYDAGDDNWIEIANYQGAADTVAIDQFSIANSKTKLRFHMISDGAWSDADGLWDTDGAFIVDDITVSDVGATINYENWEGEALDQKFADGNFWYAKGEDAFGSFCGLGNNLLDKDPCGDNFATQVIFFQGSSYPSSDYPGLFDTPFCTGPGGTAAPCQDESLVSPVIDFTLYSSGRNNVQDTAIPNASAFGGLVYEFTAYRDLPLANLIFYTWGIRTVVDGCPGQWLDRNFVYYGGDKDYIQGGWDISDLYEGDGTDGIQVQIGVADMCDAWFGKYGNCAAHTPSPWLDNVRLYRYETSGPQWAWRDLDFWQDNFAGPDGTGVAVERWVRVDAANDLRDNADPVIDPGDSLVVDCSSPIAGGLRTNDFGGDIGVKEEVYCYVKVTYEGPAPLKTSPLLGSSLEDPSLGNPGTDKYGWYISNDGLWNKFLCPTARTAAGNEADGKYMLDLNDSLFTRGYKIEYYFEAWDLNNESSTLPNTATDPYGNRFEIYCLPTLNTGILYVDDFHGRGTFDGTVQTYFDPAFAAVIPGGIMPDRYDTNGPSSLVSNGLGSRATLDFMLDFYEKVVWDSGNLNSGTITEGTDHSDKSNDADLLYNWLEQKPDGEKANLWVLGDEVANDLAGSEAQIALDFMVTACGVNYLYDSYYDLTGGREAGGVITPLVTGIDIYAGLSYYAFGGCPIINAFDVISATGTGVETLQLPAYESTNYYVGVRNQYTNLFGGTARTSWVGHSFMYVRNGDGGTLARNEFVKKTWEFFLNGVSEDVTGDTTPLTYALGQNYPNPFNPSTTIKFSIANKGHVSLKVYNVAGQLVSTLTNKVWEAGSHDIAWDGTNDLGSSVASGVYFYKLKADNYESTKKMILLR